MGSSVRDRTLILLTKFDPLPLLPEIHIYIEHTIIPLLAGLFLSLLLPSPDLISILFFQSMMSAFIPTKVNGYRATRQEALNNGICPRISALMNLWAAHVVLHASFIHLFTDSGG